MCERLGHGGFSVGSVGTDQDAVAAGGSRHRPVRQRAAPRARPGRCSRLLQLGRVRPGGDFAPGSAQPPS